MIVLNKYLYSFADIIFPTCFQTGTECLKYFPCSRALQHALIMKKMKYFYTFEVPGKLLGINAPIVNLKRQLLNNLVKCSFVDVSPQDILCIRR